MLFLVYELTVVPIVFLFVIIIIFAIFGSWLTLVADFVKDVVEDLVRQDVMHHGILFKRFLNFIHVLIDTRRWWDS